MSAQHTKRRNPVGNGWEDLNEKGQYSWGLTMAEHDAKYSRKKRIVHPNQVSSEETVTEKLAPNRTHAEAKRAPRTPLNTGNPLAISKAIIKEIVDSGYYPYWAIDNGDSSLDQYLEAYYEFHLDSNNNQIKRRSGNGFYHVLMKLPQEFKDEDNSRQAAKIRAKYTNSELRPASWGHTSRGDVLQDVAG